MIGTILLVAVLVYMAFCIGWNMLFNTNSKFRLYSVIAAGVIAFIGALVFKNVLATSDFIMPTLESMMGDSAEIQELLGISEALADNVIALVGSAITPLVFFVLFFVLEILVCIVRVIVFIVKKIAGRNKEKKKARLWVRALFGLGQALVFLLCFLVPVSFYTGVASDALGAMSGMMNGEPTEASADGEMPEGGQETDAEMQEILDMIDEVSSSPVVVAHRYTGGIIITKPLTSFKVQVGNDTERVSLDSELSAFLNILDSVSTIMEKGDPAKFGDEEAAIFETLGTSIMESKILGAAISDIVGKATTAWDNGEAFMGIDKPSLDPAFDPLTNKLFDILGDDASNAAYLEEDINTFGKLVGKVISSGLLAEMSSGEGSGEGSEGPSLDAILNEEFVTDLITILNQNARMRPLIPTLANIGLKLIGESLGIPESSDAAYTEFTTDVLNAVKNTASQPLADRITALTTAMLDSLDKLGVADADEAELTITATALANYFVEGGVVTPESATVEDIQTFFDILTEAADSSADGGAVADIYGSHTALLNGGADNPAYLAGMLLAKINTINADGTVTDKTVLIMTAVSESGLFEDDTLDDVRNNVVTGVSEKEATAVTKSVTAIINLGSKDESKTPFTVTVSAILIDDAKLDAMAQLGDEDAEKLKNSIVDVFKGGAKIVSAATNSEGEMEIGDILAGVGGVLDALAGNDDLYGADKTDKLMGAVLNSSMVKESAGLSANDVQNIISAKNENNTSYGAVLTSVSKVTDILFSLIDGGELTDEAISELVEALSTENAGVVISTVIQGDMFADIMGDPEDAAEFKVMTDFLSDIFVKAGSITDKAEHDREVAAIKQVFYIVMNTDDGSYNDGAFGENGYFGVSATEFVDSFASSKCVSGALANLDLSTIEFGGDLPAADSEALASAINAKKAGADADTLKFLNNLAKLFGLD